MLKSIAVYGKQSNPKTRTYIGQIHKWAESRQIQCIIQDRINKLDPRRAPSYRQQLKKAKVDLLVIVGGDGTLLSAVRVFFETNLPMLTVNTGKLGFLMSLDCSRIAPALEELADRDDWDLDQRVVISTTINKQVFYALNDIVLGQTGIARLVEISVTVDDEPVSTQRADGVIVSTPTGSTAYNLSAGGPIVQPQSDVLILTPISPHHLNLRSLVLPASAELKLAALNRKRKLAVTVDGQTMIKITDQDTVRITKAEQPLSLVSTTFHTSYFDTLKDKLHWI